MLYNISIGSNNIAAVKNAQTDKSVVAEHFLNSGTNHWIELHDPKVLSTDKNYYCRLVREAIEIKKHKTFNRDDGFKLSTAWNPVLNKFNNSEVPRTMFARTDCVSVVCSQHYNNGTDIVNNVRVCEENSRARRRRARGTPVSS